MSAPTSSYGLAATVCIWQILVAGAIYGQTTVHAPKPSVAETGKSVTSIADFNEHQRYEIFVAFVGEEDDLIRREIQQGRQHVRARTNYGAEIGIDDGEVHAVLDIVLDGYHRRVERRKQYDAALSQYIIARQRGTAGGLTIPQGPWRSEQMLIHNTILRLKQTLPSDDFQKLNAYVLKFSPRRQPTPDCNPFPSVRQMPNPFPSVRQMPDDLPCFLNFLRYVGEEDDLIREEPQHGWPARIRTDYSSAIGIGQDQIQSVLAVVLSGYRRQLELKQRYQDAWTRSVMAKHDGSMQSTASSDPGDIMQAYWQITNEVRSRLLQVLPGADFEKLDAYVQREFPYGHALMSAESCYTSAINREAYAAHHQEPMIARKDGNVFEIVDYSPTGCGQVQNPADQQAQDQGSPKHAIFVEASRRLAENCEKQRAIVTEEYEKYGVSPSGMTPSREYRDAVREASAIVEEARDKLRRELGEGGFSQYDAEIIKECEGYGPRKEPYRY